MQGLSMPSLITDLDGQEIVCISAMSEKSSAVNNYGELLTWGSVKNRSILSADGNPYLENLKLPTVFATDEMVFNKVAVGKEHIAAITKEGKLFTMGTEDHGKLGHDPKVISDEEIKREAERYKKAGYKPGRQENQAASIGYVQGAIKGKTIVAVDCGEAHTVCVTSDGDVYSWGRGKFGALGHAETDDIQ